MNIAGEIINLEGRSNNSGRISIDQFKTRYTVDDSEIILLKKVFGIPTLRHTPTLLTKEGCALDEKEATTIRKILQKRKQDLERGASFSKGLTLDSTRQKIRNLEILLKRIEELIGVEKETCEPSKMSSVAMSVPTMSMPAAKSSPKTDDSTEKLLILILILLLGVASDKVRSKNIKDRLGSDTIEGIIKAIQTKSIQTKNITTLLEKVTDGMSPNTSAVATTAAAAAAISDPTLRASYESLTEEYEELKNNFNELSDEKAKAEGELAGKAAAITELNKQLEDEKAKSSRIAEQAANSLRRRIETEEALEASRKQKQLFEEQIRKLEEERLKINTTLQNITMKFHKLITQSRENHNKIIAQKAEFTAAFAAAEAAHQETIRQKQEILDERDGLKATLIQKNESVAAVTEEITTLRGQLRSATEELEAARQANSAVAAELDALAANPNIADADNSASSTSASVGEQTRIKGILDALRVIYDKTNDPELLTQIEKLEGALDTIPVEDNVDEVFTSRLKSLLVQLALIDEQSREETLPTIQPQEVLEPIRERLCLLYYFSSMNWKLIKERISNVIQSQQINPGFPTNYAKNFIDTIDKIFFPELKDEDIWGVATILGKVIAALGKERGTVPSEARNIIEKIATVDEQEKAKGASNYRQILLTIRTGTSNIVPQAKKYIDADTLEIKEKTPRQFSILEIPFLYILELKLLSRYVNYILMNSPHKLECQALQPIGQS